MQQPHTMVRQRRNVLFKKVQMKLIPLASEPFLSFVDKSNVHDLNVIGGLKIINERLVNEIIYFANIIYLLEFFMRERPSAVHC